MRARRTAAARAVVLRRRAACDCTHEGTIAREEARARRLPATATGAALREVVRCAGPALAIAAERRCAVRG